ncbi:unnamed protein product [Owenia fusiformis]|uniref:Uncharacterized protein n=1 Tax=Owenia fusiformis TaxID=6347 RepID=A0A8S4PV42_OWEFU|nr:unnamed protein product [Owenia fusiformis]
MENVVFTIVLGSLFVVAAMGEKCICNNKSCDSCDCTYYPDGGIIATCLQIEECANIIQSNSLEIIGGNCLIDYMTTTSGEINVNYSVTTEQNQDATSDYTLYSVTGFTGGEDATTVGFTSSARVTANGNCCTNSPNMSTDNANGLTSTRINILTNATIIEGSNSPMYLSSTQEAYSLHYNGTSANVITTQSLQLPIAIGISVGIVVVGLIILAISCIFHPKLRKLWSRNSNVLHVGENNEVGLGTMPSSDRSTQQVGLYVYETSF